VVSTSPEFSAVTVWDAPAQFVAGLITGDRVMVHGELRSRQWTDADGQLRRTDTITRR
jgi:single-stranded DNA-binding protein